MGKDAFGVNCLVVFTCLKAICLERFYRKFASPPSMWVNATRHRYKNTIADNSYETIYGVGYFGLGFEKLGVMTKVEYCPCHDGAWWHQWWEANKSSFPDEVHQTAPPELRKTKSGRERIPFPADLDTHEGGVTFLTEQLKKPEPDLSNLAE